MAQSRAGLTTIPNLADSHVPLKRHAKSESSEPAADFPSLAPEPRVVLVSKSYRIPQQMAEQLTAVCREHNLRDESRLVRDFIKAGLAKLGHG